MTNRDKNKDLIKRLRASELDLIQLGDKCRELVGKYEEAKNAKK